MVSVLASSAVDRGFEPRSGQTKDYKIGFGLGQHAELDFYSASSLKQQCPWIDMSLHSDTLFWFWANQSLLFLMNAACFAEKKQIPIL
jgi:hypothetical protein